MSTTAPRAISRTWAAHTTYRECSVVMSTAVYAVTVSRTGQGFAAEVDGVPVDVVAADRVLRNADRLELLAETLDTIGKPAACNLHRELGRLGFKDHYATAADALGRPVPSLAALTPVDAYTVRNYARGQWGMTA
ncbi:hypothetical protein [Deinococcus frigens]|uniref:hypothetical protein n=1 Tax=Deinococcus frigens TaxID=249403 RepID=UPI0006898226|nr:hypothetical protein [Deinococcus frigens]